MSDEIAIRVEGLGKRYRIGLKAQLHDTFASMLLSWARSPFSSYRRLRSLTRFEDDDDHDEASSDDIIWALRDISFDVKKGEVLGIIGRNGTGKSTLLKILSRITELTTGRVDIHGRIGSLLEVGTGFHPELTGRDNVYLNGTILGMTKREIDSKFDEIVEFSGVEKFIDTPVKRYSSGMRLRLAFAVAAHLRTEIMLIDEVLAVGDAAFQRRCIDKMSVLANEGRTVLLVSHNMAVVSRLCSRGIVLDEGKMHFCGSATAAVSEYERLSSQSDEIAASRSGEGVLIRSLHLKPVGGPLVPGTPLTFLVEFEVRKKYWTVSLVFGLRTLEGQGLVLEAVDSDQVPAILTPGRHTMQVSLPGLWLRPRTYTARAKMIAHPADGTTERCMAEPLDIVIDGAAVTGLSDWVLQPNVDWEIDPQRDVEG